MTTSAASARAPRAAPRHRGVRLAAIFGAMVLLQAAVVLAGLLLLRR